MGSRIDRQTQATKGDETLTIYDPDLEGLTPFERARFKLEDAFTHWLEDDVVATLIERGAWHMYCPVYGKPGQGVHLQVGFEDLPPNLKT